MLEQLNNFDKQHRRFSFFLLSTPRCLPNLKNAALQHLAHFLTPHLQLSQLYHFALPGQAIPNPFPTPMINQQSAQTDAKPALRGSVDRVRSDTASRDYNSLRDSLRSPP